MIMFQNDEELFRTYLALATMEDSTENTLLVQYIGAFSA